MIAHRTFSLPLVVMLILTAVTPSASAVQSPPAARRVQMPLPVTLSVAPDAPAARIQIPARAPSAALAPPETPTTRARLERGFGQLPLYFVANRGQLDAQVAYAIQGHDKTIYFTAEGVTFALTAPPPPTAASPAAPFAKREQRETRESPAPCQRWAVKLDFVGANRVRPVGQDKTEAVISYFKGHPEEWHAGLPTYARIVYVGLWPGIDLVYYGTLNRLKYEFVVHPGADPAQIQLAYRGATDVRLNAAGQLAVTTPLGGFSDDVPVAYQEIDGQRVAVDVAYDLTPSSPLRASPLQVGEGDSQTSSPLTGGTEGGQGYGFALGPYDPAHPLILDPAVLVYCGYIGGAEMDAGYGIAVDGAGCAYIMGRTHSTDFPVAVGPDLTHNGSADAFVAKVNAAGSGLLYCGYIGGSEYEYGYGIAVDGAGYAYVTGYTYSSDFPASGGWPFPCYASIYSSDAFVAKVSVDGSGLDYCGCIGGEGGEWGFDIAVDDAGRAYVTGLAGSDENAGFPVKVGPDLTYNGSADAFVARVNAAGTDLDYCGYIGGAKVDEGYGIAVDDTNCAYVTGRTGYDEATIGDAFVAKVEADGSDLDYYSYIGGAGEDWGYGIAVDGLGRAYITGGTDSLDFPVINWPFTTYGGMFDAFVARVNAAGTGLDYCGYIGGADDDYGYDIAVPASGASNVYITGGTLSSEATFPVVGGPDLTYNGSDYCNGENHGDAFVAKVKADASGLDYCGYIGGSSSDCGMGIAVPASGGDAYITGVTCSSDFTVTVGPGYSGNGDAFVAKVSGEAITTSLSAVPAVVVADGVSTATVTLSYAPAGHEVQILSGRGITDTIAPISGTVNAYGVYTTTIRSSTRGWATLTAEDLTTGQSFAAEAQVRFVDGTVLSATPAEVVADGVARSVIVLRHAPPGHEVQVVSSRGATDLFEPVSGTTDVSGTFTTTIRSQTTGSAFLTAEDLTTGEPFDASTTVAFVELWEPVLTARPTAVPANGTATAMLTLSNAPPGHEVQVSSDRGAADTFSQVSGTTDVSGTFTTTVRSSTPGTALVTAEVITGGQTIAAPTTKVRFLPSTPVLVAEPTSVPTDTCATITLYNAPSGHQVRLLSSRGSVDEFARVSGSTDISGTFSTTVQSAVPGIAVITAQDLSAGQTFATSAQIEFTGGDVLTPTDQAVDITAIHYQYPLDGRYLEGIAVPNEIAVTVDWKGAAPGRVDFVLNGVTYSEPANTTGASHTFDMGHDLLPLWCNSLRIVAYNADGASSNPQDYAPFSIPLPLWLDLFVRSPVFALALSGQYEAKYGYEYVSPTFVIPPGGVDMHAPTLFTGPPGSKTKIGGQIGAGMRIPLSLNMPLRIIGEGSVKSKVDLVSVSLGGDVKGNVWLEIKNKKGEWGWERPEASGNARLEFKVYGQKNWPVIDFVPMFVPQAAPLLTPVLLAPYEARSKLLGDVYLQGNLRGRGSASIALGIDPFSVGWKKLKFEFGPGAEAGYHFKAGKLGELKLYLGTYGLMAYEGEGEDPIQSLQNLEFKKITIRGEAGAVVRVFWLQNSGKFIIEWVYPPSPGALSAITLAEPSSGWQLIGHSHSPTYATFQAQPDTQQSFALTHTPDLAAQSVITSVLVSDVYTYPEPALAVNYATDDALLLWTHDDVAKPVGQSHELYFSRWDGITWSTPAGVTNDHVIDEAPQVAWAGAGPAVAVWSRLPEPLAITATLNVTTLQKLEIATAAYDPATNAWSPVSMLTTNNALDLDPQLARNEAGHLLAVWQQNPAGLLSGDAAHPDRIMAAFHDGDWGAPAVALEGIPGLVDLAAGYGDGAATIAYTRFLAPTGQPTPTLQLCTTAWNGANWSAPVQRTDDALQHRNPQVVYNAANQPLLVWIAGDELRLRNLSTSHTATLVLADGAAVNEFRLLQDGAGSIAAVFTAQHAQRDLYLAFYDQAHQVWGQPRPLTHDQAHEVYPSAGLDAAGRLLLGYASTAVAPVEHTAVISGTGEVVTYTVPTEGATDLLTLSYDLTRAVTLDSLAVSAEYPTPSDEVVLTATVRNSGDLALAGVSVRFYDDDPAAGGALIATRALGAPLASGFTATLTTTYTVPPTGGSRLLTAVVEVPGETVADRGAVASSIPTFGPDTLEPLASQASQRAFGPDLALVGGVVDYWGGHDVGLRPLVRNLGTSASPPATLLFYQDTLSGTLAVTTTVPALAAGAEQVLTTPWRFGALAEGSYPLVATVNPGEFRETFAANNVCTLTLEVRPDLQVSPYYLWSTPLTASTAAVTATVYNVGPVAAQDVTVGFYRRGTLDESALLFTRHIPLLPPASATTVAGEAAGPLGCGIYVMVDPHWALTETTRANNLAGACATGGRCANFVLSPVTGAAPLTVSFTDTSSGANTAWEWGFGDGQTSTQPQPTHEYTQPGAYTVTLRVSGPDSADEFTRARAVVVREPVQADFQATPLGGGVPLPVTFTDESRGDVCQWQWDFGDGVTSTLTQPTHVYAAAGTYTVTLQVSGRYGTDTLVRPGYVHAEQRLYLPLVLRESPSTAP